MGYGLPRNPANEVRELAKSVDSNAEPGDSKTTAHSDQTEPQNNRQGSRHRFPWDRRQHTEVENNDRRDKHPQQQQELALGNQIRLARLIDQFGNLEHGTMHRQLL